MNNEYKKDYDEFLAKAFDIKRQQQPSPFDADTGTIRPSIDQAIANHLKDVEIVKTADLLRHRISELEAQIAKFTTPHSCGECRYYDGDNCQHVKVPLFAFMREPCVNEKWLCGHYEPKEGK